MITCTSTHCERRQECGSPSECVGSTKNNFSPAMYEARIALLEAEVKRAREVLTPFATKACGWEQNHPGYRGADSLQISHRLGDFRTARAFMIWSERSGVDSPVTEFTVQQWDDATDALADAMDVEDACASDLVRIVVEVLDLPPLSPEARLQQMMDVQS